MIEVFTDSTTSLPQDMLEALGIHVVSLTVRYDGKEYQDATMDVDEFYRDIYNMADNPPVSSQPSPKVLEDAFEECAKAGHEALGVWISSKMSGTFEAAVRAARAVKARCTDFRFAMVDSTTNSFDEGWPVVEGARAVASGATLEQAAQTVLEAICRCRFVFSPESLTFLQKGGRIGKAAALVGNLVKLCPILTVADEETSTAAKVRTHKRALERMESILAADMKASGGLAELAVHYIGDKTEAVAWAHDRIEPLVGRAVRVLPVSPVIGTHVGPAVGLAYECREPVVGKWTGDLQRLVCYG